MEREKATQLLNKLVDDRIMQVKDEVEREIEQAVDGQMAEMKRWLLQLMEENGLSAHVPQRTLPKAEEPAAMTWEDSLKQGLDLLEKYCVQGIDELPLTVDLRLMIEEARELSERIRQFAKNEGVISQTVQELAGVDRIIHRYGADKGALIQILLDIQEQNHWLPATSLRWVSERLGVPLSQIYQIVTFYKAFSLKPEGRHHLKVCMGTACQVRGGQKLLDRAGKVLDLEPGQTDEEQRFTFSTVNCLGCCASAPVMVVDDQDYYSSPSGDKLGEIVAQYN